MARACRKRKSATEGAKGDGWIELEQAGRRNFRLPFASPFVPSLPLDCCRALVYRSAPRRSSPFKSIVTLANHGDHLPVSVSSPPSILESWSSAKAMVTPSFGWVPDKLEFHCDEATLLSFLRSGQLCVICDGSFKLQVGSASAKFCSRLSTESFFATCQTPGLPDDQSAPRSEMAGLLMVFMILSWCANLVTFPRIGPRPRVTIACDCDGALKRAFDDSVLLPSTKHSDILSTIHSLRRALPFATCPRHVSGHADRKRPVSELDWWERCNVEVDDRAQAFCDILIESSPIAPNPRFFDEPSAMYLDGVKQSSLSLPPLLDLVSFSDLAAYWSRKDRITLETFEEIDWAAIRRAMNSLPSNIQRWVAKHTVGMCGVGKFRRYWTPGSDPSCPRYKDCEIEDALHVPRCRGRSAAAEWTKRHDLFRSWLIANKTAPEIKTFLCDYLLTVRSPSRGVPTLRLFPLHQQRFHQARASQALIGAQGLLEGLLSRRWRLIQQHHFRSLGLPHSVDLWASRVVQQLMMIGHAMWKDRNSVFHSKSNSHFDSRQRDVNLGIEEQYKMGFEDLPQRVRSNLHTPLQTVLSRSLAEREQWLGSISKERALVRRGLLRQHRLMYDLTHRGTPSSTGRSSR